MIISKTNIKKTNEKSAINKNVNKHKEFTISKSRIDPSYTYLSYAQIFVILLDSSFLNSYKSIIL